MRATNITYFENRVKVVRDRYDHVLRFDSDNSYPQRIREYVRSSGTATACVNLFARFIEGEGFEDEKFYKSIINYKGQTIDQILRLIAADYALHGGFAIHVNYNALFEIDSISHIHWEHVRFGLPDDWGYIPYVAIFDDWDRKNQTKENTDRLIDYLDIFNPDPEAVRKQVERDEGIGNYKGQVLYYTGDCQEYPLAPFHSVIEDVQSDAETKIFRLRNLQNGFMATSIVKTPEFKNQEQREDFQAGLRQFQGSRNASKLLHLESNSTEEGGGAHEFEIDNVQLQNVDKHFEYSERTAKDAIIGSFNQPIQLHPIRVSGKLGSSEEIREAFLYYNEFTRRARRIFSETFERIAKRFSRPINTSDNFDIIPLAYGASQAENENVVEEVEPINTEGDGNLPNSGE